MIKRWQTGVSWPTFVAACYKIGSKGGGAMSANKSLKERLADWYGDWLFYSDVNVAYMRDAIASMERDEMVDLDGNPVTWDSLGRGANSVAALG